MEQGTFDFSALIKPELLSKLESIGPSYFAYGSRGAKTWRDIGDERMEKVINSILDGNNWEDSIHQQTKGQKWVNRIALSPNRALFLDLLDYSDVNTALDLGAGWGALTLGLADRVPQVISIEPTKERLDVIRAICAQENRTNVGFLLGDIFDLPLRTSVLDLILLCGVYEWLGNNGTEDDVGAIQQRALTLLSEYLTPTGQLVIAIENRLGLKYLLGEHDDHTKARHICYLPFEEAQAQFEKRFSKSLRARTYDQLEYRASLENAGFSDIHFYLAFPDYKLPQLLLPAENPDVIRHVVETITMPDEHDGSRGQRSFYNEIIKRAYRAMSGADLLSFLAPSFIIVAKK